MLSKHSNKIYILQKYARKINILKSSSNKKWIVLLIWSGESSIKFESEQECWQIKCWGGWICSGRLICDKNKFLRGVMVFVAEKNDGKKNEEGRVEDRLSDHKLNIRDRFTDEFNRRV